VDAVATAAPVKSATWAALGTSVDLLVVDGDLLAARSAVDRCLESVDRTYSRFRPDSELSQLNARAGRTATLSPLLARAVAAALRAARLTDGLVDPTVGRAIRKIGYDDDFPRARRRTDPLVVRIERVPGWQTLRVDAVTRTFWAPFGVELDLGSTGKALAADLAARAALDAMGRGGVLLSLGGDIAIAGCVPDGGWRVLVTEDSAAPPDGDGDVIALLEGAIATSSTTVRRWRRGNVALHHLIDPRTALPAAGPWRTASVIAANCVDANIVATAAIIQGETAPRWLEGFGLSARLVSNEGDVLRLGAWPSPTDAGRHNGPRNGFESMVPGHSRS
jgi:thiamine biosynthesis lipoprotein